MDAGCAGQKTASHLAGVTAGPFAARRGAVIRAGRRHSIAPSYRTRSTSLFPSRMIIRRPGSTARGTSCGFLCLDLVAASSLILCLASCKPSDARSRYSVVDPAAIPAAGNLSSEHSFELVEILRLGQPVGEAPDAFGHITGAAFGQDGGLYVIDSKASQVVSFDSIGRFRRFLGRRGSEAGGLLNPANLSTRGRMVSVYDAAMRAIVAFDSAGALIGRTLTPPGAVFGEMTQLDSTSFLVPVVSRQSSVALFNRTTGAIRPALRRSAGPDEGSPTRRMDIPGHVCVVGEDTAVYANPFIYELVSFAPSVGRLYWVREWNSKLLRPGNTEIPESRRAPAALLLGLVCDSRTIVVAYLSMASKQLYYDVFDGHGDVVARRTFARSDTSLYPGFVAAIRGDRLLTYRTKPFNQVFVYRLSSNVVIKEPAQ
jgi:hypothetical protein